MQALATGSRVRILACLREAPRSVGDLVEALEMEQSAVSHQLRLFCAISDSSSASGSDDRRSTPSTTRTSATYSSKPSSTSSTSVSAAVKPDRARASVTSAHAHAITTPHGHDHYTTATMHGHSHGLVDPSIVRSREGVKAVSISASRSSPSPPLSRRLSIFVALGSASRCSPT